MSAKLGESVALGLLADATDFSRLREHARIGLCARMWRRVEDQVSRWRKDPGDGFSGSLTEMTLFAAVNRRADVASLAVERALELAAKPYWIHREAGCLGLLGMHHAHELCHVADWLWPILNRDQREAILGAVIAKAVENLSRAPNGVRDETDDKGQLLFARRMDKSDRHCLHPKPEQVNNWDLWFSSGLFMAARLVERAFLHPDPSWPKLEWGHYYDVGYTLETARIAKWKALAVERIHTAIATQIGPDGDYAEGISYAQYGGDSLLTALLVLSRAGIDAFPPGLVNLPSWMRHQFIADIPFGAANFNDAKIRTAFPAPLLAHLASREKSPKIQAYAIEAIELQPGTPGHLTLLGFNPTLPAAPAPLEHAVFYQHTGAVFWRTSQTRDGLFFAMKSGAYGGAHQHQDRNSIFLSAYGEHLIVDTGDSRYANPPASPHFGETRAHNCVLVDGRGQIGSNDNPTRGRIVEHRDEVAFATAIADATACTPGVEANLRRAVFLKPDLIMLADRVRGKCDELTWILQGCNDDGSASWSVSGRHLILSRPLAKLHVFLSENIASVAIAPGTLDGAQQGVLRVEAIVPGKFVTAALAPVRFDEPPPTCEWHNDGEMTIALRGRQFIVRSTESSITVNGQTYSV